MYLMEGRLADYVAEPRFSYFQLWQIMVQNRAKLCLHPSFAHRPSGLAGRQFRAIAGTVLSRRDEQDQIQVMNTTQQTGQLSGVAVKKMQPQSYLLPALFPPAHEQSGRFQR